MILSVEVLTGQKEQLATLLALEFPWKMSLVHEILPQLAPDSFPLYNHPAVVVRSAQAGCYLSRHPRRVRNSEQVRGYL